MLLLCKDCGIMISVSVTGSGKKNVNAAVLMEPDKFATEWSTCGSCGGPHCIKCSRKRGGVFRKPKCECGGVLSKKHNVSP